jgi:cytochrome oxidase Cu insertion factor (SCO1/SenC/PrrC family)
MLHMPLHTPQRAADPRPGPLLAALAATAALALVSLTGCSSSGAEHGAGAGASAGAGAGAPSASGFDGALLPASLRPREFSLTDQGGREVSLRALRGRVVILTFLYTNSKTTAPLVAQQIRGALDELEAQEAGGKPAQGRPIALAISVDPAGDTPARVRAFLRASSLTGRLEYLTGTPARLRAVWHAYSVVPAAAGPIAYERSAFVLLLDRAGAPRVEFPLEELTPEALAHDVRRLESE